MHDLRASHCALCRQPYIYFPSICQQLHYLLLKMEPVAYRRRDHEVLEEEKHRDVFSPQFGDTKISDNKPGGPEEIERSSTEETGRSQDVKESCLLENGVGYAKGKQVSVDDLLCALCKEFLFLPAVLNCGHVFCDSCMSGLATKPLNCPVCESLHPGEFPNVCLDLDHFLQEQFPKEYLMRKERATRQRAECQCGESSSSALREKKKGELPYPKDDNLFLEEDLRNVHVGVGCDSCGMYPLVGKRYKCKDCKEVIGFDLCETCYNSSSKLPGRFNQQHTPDHEFEIDDSNMLCKILFRSLMDDPRLEHPSVITVLDISEVHDDLDAADEDVVTVLDIPEVIDDLDTTDNVTE